MKKNVCLLLLTAVCAAGPLMGADGTWTASGDGNWSNTANWQDSTPASGSGSTAYLTTGFGTINNDETSLALLGLQISGSGYTFIGNAITLDSAGFITVLGGTHTVSLPLVLQGSTAVAAASGQTLTLSGAISGDGGLTTSGGRVVLGNPDNSYLGHTVQASGTLQFATVSSLGSASAGLTLGDGTFRYTGDSASLGRGFTILAGATADRASVLDVVNSGTTLTVPGQIVSPGGVFLKTGEGTVAFTYPGYQEFGTNRVGGSQSAIISYDENGVADINGYTAFTIDKGRVILGAAGQTNIIAPGDAWIGTRTLASPRLDVVGGYTEFRGGYLSIGRGTGTTNSPQMPSLYINNGAYVNIEGSGLVMDNANGQDDHKCRPYLSIDNGTLRTSGEMFIGEDPASEPTVLVDNGGSLISDTINYDRWGLSFAQNYGAQANVTFANNSLCAAYHVTAQYGSTLNVNSGSTLMFDDTTRLAVNNSLNQGTVKFNGGTLTQRTSGLGSAWFVKLGSLLVGVNGMTINSDGYAWLDPVLTADPSSTGGSVTKTGSGTLAMRPTPMTVQVNAGKIMLATEYPWSADSANGTFSLASGSALELAAGGSAAGMALNLSGNTLTYTAPSLCSQPDLWQFNGGALWRADGLLELTPDIGSSASTAFLRRRYPVTNAWTATFSYLGWDVRTPWNPADGISFIIHNNSAGTTYVGGGATASGYDNGGNLAHSFGIVIDVYNKYVRFGKEGSLVDAYPFPSDIPHLSSPNKTLFSISYDGAGQLTLLMTPPGCSTYRYTYDVDLSAQLASSDGYGYIGFGAGTGGCYAQHTIADFMFSNSLLTTPTPYCRYGGNVTLGAGDTLTANVTPTPQQRGFVGGSLSYANGAVLDATKPISMLPPAPTMTDQGLWKLNNNAHWRTDGRLALSEAVNGTYGTAYTTNRYTVSGSWTARFKYDIGGHSDPAADYFTFSLQNRSPSSGDHFANPGLALMWRYYQDGPKNYLKLYTNQVEVMESYDTSPVVLPSGGIADIEVTHNPTAQTITVIMSQAAGTYTYTNVITGVDLRAALAGADSAYLGFGAATGGLNAENIVSDFSFASDAVVAASLSGYVAFDQLSGSGVLTKRGSAALGFQGDIDRPTSNAAVRLEQGGLVLRKSTLEPLDTTGPRSDWHFSPIGKWGPDGTLQYCNSTWVGGSDTACSTRRFRVSEAWTATFSYQMGAVNWAPQDAFSFFVHNDPRGPAAVGNNNVGAGYEGIVRSTGIRWCIYPDHPLDIRHKSYVGHGGAFDYSSGQSYLPIIITDAETFFVIRYDPTAATLTSVITQGSQCVTNVFTGVNIAADVGDNYAYVGFGAGNGGACSEVRIRNFRMTADQPSDVLPNLQSLVSLTLPAASTNTATLDTSLPNGSFQIASATVGDGAFFGVDTTGTSGSLTLASVTQSGVATYPVDAGCTLALNNVSGGTRLVKQGAGTLTLTGSVATYSGATVLQGGTLSLASALLPPSADMSVTNGATLNLAFTGKQYAHALTVNGAPMLGGRYTAANTTWITGPGALLVTFPPQGTVIFIR